MAWQKAGREDSKPNWQKGPRSLEPSQGSLLKSPDHDTTWLHLGFQAGQEASQPGALSHHNEQTYAFPCL